MTTIEYTAFSQHVDDLYLECSECPDAGPVATAAYVVEYEGPDPLDTGRDCRREYACKAHLSTLIDYALTVNAGWLPVTVQEVARVERAA